MNGPRKLTPPMHPAMHPRMHPLAHPLAHPLMHVRHAALALATLVALAAPVHAQQPAAAASAPQDTARPTLVRGSCTRPEYPIASARAGEAGTSVMRLEVDAKGTVTRITLSRSSGHARLDAATEYALSACRFEPARDSAGTAVPATTLMQHVWRLQDAPPDPWAELRKRGAGGRPATADLAAVPFSTATRANPEQRLKILRALQQEATEQAGCGSVEQVSVGSWPAAVPATPVMHPTTGREVPGVREMWSARQCGQGMNYLLLMLFPEGEAASFRMLPMPDLAAGALVH